MTTLSDVQLASVAELVVRGVHKRYGTVRALVGVDLTVATGLLVAVLGPSGCGKTTLLRCVAGFERVDGGTVALGGRTVAGPGVHVPPHRRRAAIVPQEGALFPHLSVAANVGYGLDREQRRRGRVDEVLELVGLAGYGSRMPHELSGGQQQRTAVARALAPRPPMVLLDEPFSALDAGLRSGVRTDIRAALAADGATALLVTHDQSEALSMADQVVVLRDGTAVQQGTPAEVYRCPADPWVARFVGDAVLLAAHADGARALTPLGLVDLTEPRTGQITVLLRPEQIHVRTVTAPSSDMITAVITQHHFHGHDTVLDLLLPDQTPVRARVLDDRVPYAGGMQVELAVSGAARPFDVTA
jgi:iron(III) transport system ATP-binding protein